MNKKVLMACANYWTSPFQVGSQQIAKGFLKAGWEVAFISDPLSPLHLLGKQTDLRARYELYRQKKQYCGRGHLWPYVPGALFVPHNKPFLRNQWVYDNWVRYTWPNVLHEVEKQGFGAVDLLYMDSLVQPFWLKTIKYRKAVLRIPDYNAGFDKYTATIAKAERYLAQNVDAVMYTARNLQAYVEALRPRRSFYFPNGVNFNHFNQGSRVPPAEYQQIPEPRVVYVGALERWFDFNLVNFITEQLPQLSFVLIGPDHLARQKLISRPNLFILGRRDYEALPPYLHNAAVGIIPFDVAGYPQLVNNVNPLKLYEYLACGLPAVAVAWAELQRFEAPVFLSHNQEQFVAAIKEALAGNFDRAELKAYARNKDWTNLVLKLIAQMGLEA